MKRTFVYSALFEKALKSKKSWEHTLNSIENAILENCKVGDVIQGTGGVRKFRLEDARRGKGKRGGLRVLYLDLPHVERTHLLVLYDKGQADDLSTEGKNLIREIVEDIKGAGS